MTKRIEELQEELSNAADETKEIKRVQSEGAVRLLQESEARPTQVDLSGQAQQIVGKTPR